MRLETVFLLHVYTLIWLNLDNVHDPQSTVEKAQSVAEMLAWTWPKREKEKEEQEDVFYFATWPTWTNWWSSQCKCTIPVVGGSDLEDCLSKLAISNMKKRLSTNICGQSFHRWNETRCVASGTTWSRMFSLNRSLNLYLWVSVAYKLCADTHHSFHTRLIWWFSRVWSSRFFFHVAWISFLCCHQLIQLGIKVENS